MRGLVAVHNWAFCVDS